MNKNKLENELKEWAKAKDLSKNIYESLNINVPEYITHEIVCKGRKNNIIALTNLAILNNTISLEDAILFKKNLDTYL